MYGILCWFHLHLQVLKSNKFLKTCNRKMLRRIKFIALSLHIHWAYDPPTSVAALPCITECNHVQI